MKADKIILGVTLILFGILFLFANLHILDWNFISGLWKLWPLVLVLWGLDLILKESPLLKTIIFLLLVLGAFVLYFFKMSSEMDSYSLKGGHREHATVSSVFTSYYTG